MRHPAPDRAALRTPPSPAAPARPARWPLLATAAAALALSACSNLAPVHRTPDASAAVAPTLTSAGAAAKAPPRAGEATLPLAELNWRTLILEPRLRQTVALALRNSRSLRLAVLAVQQARASHDIQAADTLPTLNGSAGASASRTPAQANSSGEASSSRSYSVGLGVSAYELDLFGRVHNLKEAALQAYLQTDEARRSTQLTLIGDVSSAWLTLAADLRLQALAQRTLASYEHSLRLSEQRQALGADSGLTVQQARTQVASARLALLNVQSQVQLDRHALELLVGATVPEALLPSIAEPELAARTDTATATTAGSGTGAGATAATAGTGAGPAARDDTAAPASVATLLALPDELPSALLQQRPDVLAAERALAAASANIGAARAAFYPTISLTASAGTASRTLLDLFKGGAWSLAPQLTLPIFDHGANTASLRSAEATRDARLASYEQTLQTAFREARDALTVRDAIASRLDAQQAVVDSATRQLALTDARFRAGQDSRVELLDAQRTLWTAQQGLIALQLQEQTNRITLFKVLGGGWQGEDDSRTASR